MVTWKRRVLFWGMIFFLSRSLAAQTYPELHALIRQNPLSEETHPGFQVYPSEMKTAVLGVLRLYQIFIATQDMPVCNFTPSCSHFAEDAFRAVSPFRALLLASDRLLRDNPSVAGHYPINPKTGHFSDPLALYLKLIQGSAEKKLEPTKHAKATKRQK